MVKNKNFKIWEFRLIIRRTAATGVSQHLIAFTTQRKKYSAGAITVMILPFGLLPLLGQFVRKDKEMCANKAEKQNQERRLVMIFMIKIINN